VAVDGPGAHRARLLWIGSAALAAAFVTWSLWPRPLEVDVVVVDRGDVRVELLDEGRTRMRDTYVVGAPIAGRVLRVDVHPGDRVARGDELARIAAAPGGFLDSRSDLQARAAVDAAAATLRAARAEAELAEREYARVQALRWDEVAADAAVEEAQALRDARRAAVDAAAAELARARGALLPPDRAPDGTVRVRAPVDGVVLRVPQRSEAVLPTGTPLVEVGDPARLEVVAEFLSQDAVRIRAGAAAIVEGWGGPPLAARVQRVEPVARTKVSALGVEEQRTNVILDFADPAAARALGHDFRVDARVVVDEVPDAVRVPLGALFRTGQEWAVFRIEGRRARLTPVTAGAADDAYRVVTRGLEPGDAVIVYPSSAVADGTRVAAKQR
jgi:HlyD family secretion protein